VRFNQTDKVEKDFQEGGKTKKDQIKKKTGGKTATKTTSGNRKSQMHGGSLM